MSAQIGIPNYKDEINSKKLNEIKEYLNALCIDYSKLSSSEAINNRESDKYDEYVYQYEHDIVVLKDIISLIQKLQNSVNDSLFTISTRSVYSHLLS